MYYLSQHSRTQTLPISVSHWFFCKNSLTPGWIINSLLQPASCMNILAFLNPSSKDVWSRCFIWYVVGHHLLLSLNEEMNSKISASNFCSKPDIHTVSLCSLLEYCVSWSRVYFWYVLNCWPFIKDTRGKGKICDCLLTEKDSRSRLPASLSLKDRAWHWWKKILLLSIVLSSVLFNVEETYPWDHIYFSSSTRTIWRLLGSL